jgi:hypothetical protein
MKQTQMDYDHEYSCHLGCGTMATCPIFIIDATSIACPRPKQSGTPSSNQERKESLPRKGSTHNDRILIPDQETRHLLLHWAGYRSIRRQTTPPPFTTAVLFSCFLSISHLLRVSLGQGQTRSTPTNTCACNVSSNGCTQYDK